MFGGLKYVSRAALVAAAVSMGGVAAQAADLGGNCCADLEERVAELEATTARKGNRVMSLQVYGQINRAMVWHDDNTNEGGTNDVNEFSFRDNDGRSGTRFGFQGSAAVTSDVSMGFRLELATADDTGTAYGTVRHSAVYIQSASLGRITFGRTSTATDGLAEIALATAITPFSPEEASSVSPVASWVGAFVGGVDGSRRQGVHYTSPTVAGFILSASYFHNSNADDDGDNDADGWDAALRYAGEFGAIRVAAGVGYRMTMGGLQDQSDKSLTHQAPNVTANTDLPDEKTFIISGSLMHTPTGLFVNAGFADVEDAARRPAAFGGERANFGGFGTRFISDYQAWQVGVGVAQNWFGIGTTTISGDYGEADLDNVRSYTSAGAIGGVIAGAPTLSYWGIGISQNINAAATDLYINYRQYDLDGVNLTGADSGNSDDEAGVLTAGMRVRF
jgi:hypothetical protein